MKVYCEHCGHSINFLRNHYLICRHCGYKVYPTEKAKFIDKLKEAMRKRRKYEQSRVSWEIN